MCNDTVLYTSKPLSFKGLRPLLFHVFMSIFVRGKAELGFVL